MGADENVDSVAYVAVVTLVSVMGPMVDMVEPGIMMGSGVVIAAGSVAEGMTVKGS